MHDLESCKPAIGSRQKPDCQQGEQRTVPVEISISPLPGRLRLGNLSFPAGPDAKACFDTDTPHVRKALANFMLGPHANKLKGRSKDGQRVVFP